MHAAIVRPSIPGGVNDARLKNLKENIVPRVSGSSGFVAGYWLDAVDEHGLTVLVFEDEAAAKAAVPPPGTDMGEGVTIESVEFRAVIAKA